MNLLKKRLIPLPIIDLIAAILLFTPLVLRVLNNDPLLAGTESYLIQGLYGRLVEPLGTSVVMISVILGVVSVHLFTLLEQRFTKGGYAPILFIINPLFIGLFTIRSQFTLVLPLLLFTFLMADRRANRTKGKIDWPSIILTQIPLILILFISPISAFFTAFGLLLIDKRQSLIGLILITLLAWVAPPINQGPLLITEFGQPLGISLFFVALGLAESVILWSQKRARKSILIYLLLLCASFYFVGARVLASIASVVLSARLLYRFSRRKWLLKNARSLTLLLLACSFLFLLLTQISTVTHEEPTKELVTLISDLPNDGGTLLTPNNLAPIVSGLSKHKIINDHCGKEICPDIKQLYHSWRSKDASDVLDKREIKYLIITKEMRDGTVWNRDEEGLLFLLKHSKRFKKISSNTKEELWKYVSYKSGALP